MKTLIFPLFILFLLSAGCNKEQQLLNDVAGDWTIESIDYQLEDGSMLAVDFDQVTINFEPCSSDENQTSNRCSMTVKLADGAVIAMQYDVLTARTNGERTLQTYGTQGIPDELIESRIYQTLQGSFGHNITRGLLSATNSKNGAPYSVDGQLIADGAFTLRQQ